jgi:hypothetical protein
MDDHIAVSISQQMTTAINQVMDLLNENLFKNALPRLTPRGQKYG